MDSYGSPKITDDRNSILNGAFPGNYRALKRGQYETSINVKTVELFVYCTVLGNG